MLIASWSHGYRVADSVSRPLFLPSSAPDSKKKDTWTFGDELTLLSSIKHHGLGNWSEISDSVSRMGSEKTPKRCMEHYLDSYLGRYGHCLPPTLADGTPVGEGGDVPVPEGFEKGQVVGRAECIAESQALFKRMSKATTEEEKQVRLLRTTHLEHIDVQRPMHPHASSADPF